MIKQSNKKRAVLRNTIIESRHNIIHLSNILQYYTHKKVIIKSRADLVSLAIEHLSELISQTENSTPPELEEALRIFEAYFGLQSARTKTLISDLQKDALKKDFGIEALPSRTTKVDLKEMARKVSENVRGEGGE